MNAIDGGIRMSVDPAAAITLAEKGRGYPALIIDGSITAPTAAESAGPEPEIPPRIIATSTAVIASEPRLWPTTADAKGTILPATPARSKISPARSEER